MSGSAFIHHPAVGDVQAPGPALDRGTGWYAAGTAIPEPPIALALVIVAAFGMRLRERRMRSAPVVPRG